MGAPFRIDFQHHRLLQRANALAPTHFLRTAPSTNTMIFITVPACGQLADGGLKQRTPEIIHAFAQAPTGGHRLSPRRFQPLCFSVDAAGKHKIKLG